MGLIKEERAFTLIEIIASITIIPLLWISLYIPLSANSMVASQMKHRIQAVNVCQQLMDTLRSTPYAALATRVGVPVTIDDRGTPNGADDLLGTADVRVIPLAGTGGHCVRIDVIVRWNERTVGPLNRAMVETLSSIISDDNAAS